MLTPDTVLQGRYRVVRQLGQGGMGAVYEAIDLRLDTVVALKETLFKEERLRKQFEREARLLARLHHQALPRVSDHFTEGDGQFLVMQYIPGEDLFEMQARRGSAFSQPDVMRWADQLCDALDYLHTQDPQIIHRDIKPQNLKLTQRGQVVLLDFGLAKGSAGQMSVVTTSASIFGYTPNYAPLEQVQGLGTDPRSDIYSLAATLYHLLTNVKPPDALSRAGAIVNGLPDPLAPADTVSAQVSRSVARVLEKAMSQKRDDRYESAVQLRAALTAAASEPASEAATVLTASGLSTAANTVTPATGTQMGGAQTKGLAGEAQTLLADESTKVQKLTSRSDSATAVRPATRQNSRTWLGVVLLLLVVVGVAGGFYLYRNRKSQAAATASPTPESSPVPSQIMTPAPTPEQALGTEIKTATPKTETATDRSRHPETKAVKPTPHPTAETVVTDRPRIPPEPPPQDPIQHQPRPTPGDNRIQTFPNGTRMEKRADGTIIVTFPDGRTRVFPAGMPPPRRRSRPTPE